MTADGDFEDAVDELLAAWGDAPSFEDAVDEMEIEVRPDPSSFQEAVEQLLDEARADGVSEEEIATVLAMFEEDVSNWADGPVDGADEDAPGFTEEQVRADAAESCEVAWREVFGAGPLPEEVLEEAVEHILACGAQGVPGKFIIFNIDPRQALAAALPAGDPRLRPLHEWMEEVPEITDFAGRALPMGSWEAEAHFQRVLRQSRNRRSPRSYRRRARSRASRQRRVRTGSVGCRSPGRPDEDDEPSDGLLARLFSRARRCGRRAA